MRDEYIVFESYEWLWLDHVISKWFIVYIYITEGPLENPPVQNPWNIFGNILAWWHIDSINIPELIHMQNIYGMFIIPAWLHMITINISKEIAFIDRPRMFDYTRYPKSQGNLNPSHV